MLSVIMFLKQWLVEKELEQNKKEVTFNL